MTVLLGTRVRRQWIHLLLGGALLMPYWLLCMTVMLPLTGTTDPFTSPRQQLLAYAAALPLVALTGLFPLVRPLSVAAARGLLAPSAALADGPAHGRSARMRGAAWYTLHIALGGLVSGATLALPPFALLLAVLPFFEGLRAPSSPWSVPLGGPTVLGPLAGAAGLVVLVGCVRGAGSLLDRLAPRLLGPTPADRLAAAEQRAAELAVRNRIARELHDSVGHALSAVTLQAGAARRVLDTDPAFAREALLAIEETTRRTVGELDAVLGLLREDGDVRGGPSLTALDVLVSGSGPAVDHVLEGDPGRLPAPVSREAYRIVQEGLSNAARHAAGAGVTLRITVHDDALEILMENPLPQDAAPTRAGGGHGLAGIADRARLLGGKAGAGPADGRWRLAVRLPLGER